MVKQEVLLVKNFTVLHVICQGVLQTRRQVLKSISTSIYLATWDRLQNNKPRLHESHELASKIMSLENNLEVTSSCRVPSLNHEVFDDPMEFNAIVVATPSEFCKVPTGLWRVFPIQFYCKSAHSGEMKYIIDL